MVEIRVYNDIAKESNDTLFMEAFGMHRPFSLENIQEAIESNPDETDFKLSIHCDGGDVDEGLAIYDYLRTSGKNLHTHIDGNCHSMAIVLLLAAPKNNRAANKNATALMHRVYANLYGVYGKEDIEGVNDVIQKSENKIAEVYEDRTELSKDEALELMGEEKMRTAEELLEWGFISKITPYNTNKKPKRMKRKDLNKQTTGFLNSLTGLFKGKGGVKTSNYDYKDAEGKLLFTTEDETDELKEGDSVTVSEGVEATGTYELEDGRIVTLTEGVVESLVNPEDVAEHIEELEEEKAELENKLAESAVLLRNYSSAHKPGNRKQNARGKVTGSNRAEMKKEALEKLKQFNRK